MPRLSAQSLSTDRQVATAKAPAAGRDRSEYRISGSPGLVLRITPAGAKTWGCWLNDPKTGRWRLMTIGRYPEISLARAREDAQRLKLALADGEDPFADRARQREALTLEALGAIYIERHAKPKKRSWKEDQRMLRHDVYPLLGRARAREVTRPDLIRLLDAVVDRGAGILANRLRALLSKLFRWAVAEGYLEQSPATGIPARVRETPRSRVLSDEELRTFWRLLDGGGFDATIADALRLQLLLGARIREITGMRREELNLDGSPATWTLPVPRGKKRGLTRPLPPLTLAILRRRLSATGSDPFVFPSPALRGRPLGEQAPTRAISRLAAKGELPGDFSSHDLRRTFATGCARLGISRDVTARLLAHAPARNDTLGRVYDQHSYSAEMLAALVTWELHILALVDTGIGMSNVIDMRSAKMGGGP